MYINFDIPKTMSNQGLLYLSRMASSVPSNGCIVEVGALFGSSTWTIAKSCDSSVKIFSIDTWKKASWIKKRFPETKFPPFSIQAFKKYVEDCHNVTAIQGYSPDIVKDTWDRKIDMYFDDADHHNPGFISNLKFWLNFVKPGGIICGDDYALGSPDIVREVDNLAKSWGVIPEIAGRVWALRVPDKKSKTSVGVNSQLPPLGEIGLKLTTVFSDLKHTVAPGLWSGRLHKPGQIKSFKLDWQNQPNGLNVSYCSGNDLVGFSSWVESGYFSQPPSSEQPFITQVAFKLTGKLADEYKISYQAGFSRPDKNVIDSEGYPNSRSYSQGKVLYSPNSFTPISALRVIVEKK